MSECQFDHVVVIGYGVVTGEVLKTVYSLVHNEADRNHSFRH